MTHSHNTVRALLADPECPWGVIYGAEDRRIIDVAQLTAFVEGRLGPDDHLPAVVESCIYSLGGRRSRVLDLWGVAANVVRFRRPFTDLAGDIYEISGASVRAESP